MDLLALGLVDGLPHRIDVRPGRPSQRRDHRPLDLPRDALHRLEVARGGEGKAGLDDVDTQEGQLARDRELLVRVERGARRLLAVAQRGVEDEDPVVDSLGRGTHQLRALPSGLSQGIMARSSAPTFSIIDACS